MSCFQCKALHLVGYKFKQLELLTQPFTHTDFSRNVSMTIISNIDLHCHTKASDGTLSPSEVVERAYNRGLNVLAITDHDLVSGVAEAIDHAKTLNAKLLAQASDAPCENFLKDTAQVLKVENGSLERTAQERLLNIIPGIEISTTWQQEQIHVVGLGVDIHNTSLLGLIDRLRKLRVERAVSIGTKLERLGFERPYERCCEKAQPGASITRGNYAHLIFEDGKARSIDDAFNKFLKRGQPAYVKTEWGALNEAVEIILQSGGVPILAHPRRYKFSNGRLKKLIIDFMKAGGEAMEVSSSQQKQLDRAYLIELCKRFDLRASMGSDFHTLGIYRDLGQNLDLVPDLKPIWTDERLAKWNLSSDFKQRLVHVTYQKSETDAADLSDLGE